MNVLFTKKFNRDISQIRDMKLAHRIEVISDEVKEAKAISCIQNLKELTGFKSTCHLSIGDFLNFSEKIKVLKY